MHIYEQWFALCIAYVGGIVSFLFLGGACSGFCGLGWAVMACRLLLAKRPVAIGTDQTVTSGRWRGLTGSVWLATVVLLAMRSI